jgi:hypothetical protein
MAREVCIKTSTGTYCTGSPIQDCTCERKTFRDPFPEVPERITDAESFMNDLRAVLVAAEKVAKDPEELAECFRVVAAITRLVLLPQVKIRDPFLIMAMAPAPPTSVRGK